MTETLIHPATGGLAGGSVVPTHARDLVSSFLASRNGVPGVALTDERGRPVPPSEVVAGLQRIDPALGLRFMPGGINQSGTWAFTLRWRQDDPRREMIRRQEMAPEDDFDALGYLPLDCPPEQAVGHFVASVKRWHGKEDVTRLLSRVDQWNTAQEARNLAPALEHAQELLEANAGTLFRDLGKTTAKVRHGRGAKRAARDRGR